jgi:hypothetical protein
VGFIERFPFDLECLPNPRGERTPNACLPFDIQALESARRD